jgi:hypothetical protein
MNAKTVLRKMTNWKSLALVAAMACLMVVPAMAQDYGGQPYQQQQQQPPPADFNDKDLEKFAKAQVKVDEIRSEYSEELSQVEDNAEAQALQEAYTQRMLQVIEKSGLSVEDYNKVIMAMQGDAELREKVNNLMN